MVGDFEHALQEVTSGDFVYLDPPYTVERQRVFNEYSSTTFGTEDLLRLRKWLLLLTRRGVPFLVSYAMSREALFLKRGFKSEVVHVRRSIAGFAGSRRMAAELLIYNQS
jgi:DNA adenine methylase